MRSFRKFYLVIDNYQIWKSRFPNLTWTHVFKSLRVEDDNAEEQLRTEIERQKQLFMLQHENSDQEDKP